MYCQKCGFKNEDDVKFCMKCGSAMEAASAAPASDAAPAAAPAPAVAATAAPSPATTVPVPVAKPVDEATRFESPAFILSIIAIVLLIIPIPILAWFSLPCGIIGFMFAFYGWTKCREQDGKLTIKTVCAIVFCAYVLLNALTLNMGGSDGILDALGSFLGGMAGSMY